MIASECSRSFRRAPQCSTRAASGAFLCRGKRCFTAARPSRSSPGGRKQLRVEAIGFDFGDGEREIIKSSSPPRPSVKVYNSFGLRAASLLVYQHIFKGPIGEAFLGLMTASQKYQASNKEIVGAYSRLYQLLLVAGYDSWQDYVLDQILLGRDNPFARAVAQGNLQEGAPLMKAVAYDLDTLQSLVMPLQQLAEYVGEVAPTVSQYWVEAASSASLDRPAPSKSLPSALPAGPAPAIALPSPTGSSSSSRTASGSGSSSSAGSSSSYISRPCTEEELEEWKGLVAGHETWGEAALLLKEYYHTHGFGITSRNTVLRWNKGAFEEASLGGCSPPPSSSPAAATSLPAAAADPAARTTSRTVLRVLEAQYTALAANTLRHCQGLAAQHALVCGPPGSGKSWLLWEGTLLAGAEEGLRLVEVPASEVRNILDIARGCARYPRVRFVLVMDHVDLPLGGDLAKDLMAGLSGAGGNAWPSNTLLYIGVSAASTVSKSDPIALRCPLVVPMPQLSPSDYFDAVAQLLEATQAAAGGLVGNDVEKGTSSKIPVSLSPEMMEAASAWMEKPACGPSVRTAASFVRLAT